MRRSGPTRPRLCGARPAFDGLTGSRRNSALWRYGHAWASHGNRHLVAHVVGGLTIFFFAVSWGHEAGSWSSDATGIHGYRFVAFIEFSGTRIAHSTDLPDGRWGKPGGFLRGPSDCSFQTGGWDRRSGTYKRVSARTQCASQSAGPSRALTEYDGYGARSGRAVVRGPNGGLVRRSVLGRRLARLLSLV